MRIEDFMKKWANEHRRGFSDLGITTEGGGPPDNSNNWQKLKIACSIQLEGLPWIQHVASADCQNKCQEAVIGELLDKLDVQIGNSIPNAEKLSNRLATRPKKPILAVILGAGFSAGLHVPTTKELTNKLRKPNDEYHHWSRRGNGLYQDALKHSILPMLGTSILDIEAFISFWDGVKVQEEQAPGGAERDQYKNFLWNMAHWFAQWSREAEVDGKFKELKTWLCEARKTHEVRFITFNYDLIVERLCRGCGLPFKYLDSSVDGSFVSIHKLHGSVNYYQGCNGTNAIYNLGAKRDFVYEVIDLDRLPPETQQPPVLIPPSANKEYKHFFDCTWAFAMKDLHDAEKILLVGYSFPALDVFAKTTFSKTLFERQKRFGDRANGIYYVLPKDNCGEDRRRVKKALTQIPFDWIGEKWEPEHFWQILGRRAEGNRTGCDAKS